MEFSNYKQKFTLSSPSEVVTIRFLCFVECLAYSEKNRAHSAKNLPSAFPLANFLGVEQVGNTYFAEIDFIEHSVNASPSVK
jgi:hypothetical protein